MSTPTPEMLSTYLSKVVADRLRNDYRDADADKRKVAFLLDEYSADATEAKRIYRMDAAIDAYALDDDDDGNAIISLWQLSGPDTANIAKGTVTTPPGRKLETDLAALAVSLTKQQRHMSDDAADAITLIHSALERAADAGKAATIKVHVLSLYKITDALKTKVVTAAETDLAACAPSGLQLAVECIVYGLADYAAADAGMSGAGPQLDDLVLSLAAPNSIADYDTAYLAFAKPSELIAYYIKHGAALLHTNARFFLGKKKATANKAISASAQESAKARRFHELNNGLVITCSAVNKRTSALGEVTSLRLSRPQVVNGGQTLHTLTEVKRGEAKGKASALSKLAVPIKIVVLSTQALDGTTLTERAAEIAKASNTQAALSPRALASYAGANTELQRGFAKLTPRWFFEKTDGEWSAFRRTTDEHRKLITGVEHTTEFQFKPAGANRPTSRIVKNVEALEALLSVYGCFEDSSKDRMFHKDVHPSILSRTLSDADWTAFAAELENRRTYTAFAAKYPGQSTQTAPVRFLMLAWAILRSVRELNLTEKPRQQWVRNYWEVNTGAGPFTDHQSWLNYCVGDDNAALLDGAEQVANAMQKPIAYQMLRLLTRRYGALNEEKCNLILRLLQFAGIVAGRPVEQVVNAEKAREAKLGDTDTPIYTLYQICRNACGMVYSNNRTEIQSMGTRQQTLLLSEWVSKLSSQVDTLSNNFEFNRNKLLQGVSFISANLESALPDLPAVPAAINARGHGRRSPKLAHAYVDGGAKPPHAVTTTTKGVAGKSAGKTRTKDSKSLRTATKPATKAAVARPRR